MPYGSDFFFGAYRDLVSCRVPDGPIPWTAVMQWADRRRLSRNLAEALWTVISQMDCAERQWRFDRFQEDHGA